MTRLEAKARELAGSLPMCAITAEIAEAMVKLAREFAADALKEFCAYDDLDSGNGRRAVNEAIAAAIKAAEGDQI